MKSVLKVVLPSVPAIESSITYISASLRELLELFSSSSAKERTYFDNIFEGLEDLG